MYRLGHVGAALLAYVPVGIALSLTASPALGALGGLVALALSTLPDADEHLPIRHRGPTHSIPFVVAVSGLLGALAAGTAPFMGLAPAMTGAVCATAAAISLLSHLAADSVTPMGIRPFWPVSDRHYTFDVTPAKNPRANWALFAAGLAVTGLGAVVVVLV